MVAERLLSYGLVLGISILSAGLVIAVLLRMLRQPVALGVVPEDCGTVFLFEGSILSDATPAARRMLSRFQVENADLIAVTTLLGRRFPDIKDKISAIRKGRLAKCNLVIERPDSDDQVRIDAAHGLIRLSLTGDPLAEAAASDASVQDELQTLRSIAQDAPQLIWKHDAEGRLLWANSAYLSLADRLWPSGPDAEPVWPTRPLLPDLKPVETDGATLVQRVALMLPDATEPRWYEVTSIRRGPAIVSFGVDASSIMQAESGRQKFIQTLTKTFAHLSIGLAIFDRERRLVLFNPAFLDLTALPVGFLSARPSVNSVLDRLRDMNMLPEPKNYTNWRDQVAALEAAAVRGTYCETWSLPAGQTYRVTGRPHPDGAIAFLFEDITDEIRLTRHFRSELETAQGVLDCLDEGIAVFSRAGTLMMSNALYTQTWCHVGEGLTDINLTGELARWQDRCDPSPVWERLRSGMATLSDRARWQDTVRLDDGRTLDCRFVPLAGGSTLIGFRPQPIEKPQVTAADPSIDMQRHQQWMRAMVGT